MLLRSKRLGQDFELGDGIHLLGRSRQCQIVLMSDLTAVSRTHVQLKVAGNHVQVYDCASHNGTYVNGKKIPQEQWFRLSVGDKLMICEFDFRLLAEAENEGHSSGSCLVDADESSDLSDSKSIPISARGTQQTEDSRLRAMLVIAQSLRNALQIDEVLAQAVSSMFEILPAAERAVICLVDAQGQVEPRTWRQRDPTSKDTIRLSQTILQHVVRNSAALIVQDAFSHFEDALSVHELDMRSVMAAPLLGANEQVDGVLYVDAKSSQCFQDFDLEVLAAVATQISLALNFAQLHKIAFRDAVLRRDVEQATAVQRLCLPDSTPAIPGYELAGYYQPARHIGGDYYDFIPLDDGRLAIVVGDVVGKGVPAALSMMRLATETRSALEICTSPGQAMTRLNRKLHDAFITVVLFFLDPKTHMVSFANAGHERPLLRRVDGCVTALGEGSARFPLSVVADTEYPDETFEMQLGEALVLFSDGIPDAEQGNSFLRFGKSRLVELLTGHQSGAQSFVDLAADTVNAFMQGGTQFDDMCLVCLCRPNIFQDASQ